MNAAKGTVFKYGDNVDTDVIIPARYLNSSDPAELAAHCMEDIDKEFIHKVSAGDIIVAMKNFGCGSSREHAPIAIKAAGVSCVIAENKGDVLPGTGFPGVYAEDHRGGRAGQLYQPEKVVGIAGGRSGARWGFYDRQSQRKRIPRLSAVKDA